MLRLKLILYRQELHNFIYCVNPSIRHFMVQKEENVFVWSRGEPPLHSGSIDSCTKTEFIQYKENKEIDDTAPLQKKGAILFFGSFFFFFPQTPVEGLGFPHFSEVSESHNVFEPP